MPAREILSASSVTSPLISVGIIIISSDYLSRGPAAGTLSHLHLLWHTCRERYGLLTACLLLFCVRTSWMAWHYVLVPVSAQAGFTYRILSTIRVYCGNGLLASRTYCNWKQVRLIFQEGNHHQLPTDTKRSLAELVRCLASVVHHILCSKIARLGPPFFTWSSDDSKLYRINSSLG